MAKISKKSESMPASAIRKLVPFADAAKAEGVKVYHLNVGQPDIKSPECALEAVKKNTLDHVSYSNSAAAPNIGLSVQPMIGIHTPAANGIPIML